MKKKSDTERIIEAVKSSHDAAKSIAEAVARELSAHTKLDDVRHEENKETLGIILANVNSLLESRSFTKGIFKAVVGVAVAVSTVVGLVIAWIKG